MAEAAKKKILEQQKYTQGDLSGDFLKEGEFLIHSESVNEGHPDKLADIVSDAVLDACFEQDPDSYVACETATKTNMVMIFGEITTKAKVNYEQVIRNAIKDVGYDDAESCLDMPQMNAKSGCRFPTFGQLNSVSYSRTSGRKMSSLGCDQTERRKSPLSTRTRTELWSPSGSTPFSFPLNTTIR